MPEERLRKTLIELGQDPELTEESREAVELAQAALDSGEHQGLRQVVERLEQRHPRLTLILGRMADILSEMGI